ncbi:MAG: SEC-C domain-containing protein [Methanotrichaceae archaeon]|nr:SEC-C domain-containing protein [Methanotrichaceae archaeon]
MVDEYLDEELEEISKRVYGWFVEFTESKYFEELTEEQKSESEFAVMSFADYMYSYFLSSPEEWNEDELEECCLETLPRKVSADESFFESIAPVLSAFFSYLGEKDLLENGSQLARTVRGIDEEIARNASDPRNWGMAKSFVMAANDAGVDITKEGELQRYMQVYNTQRLAAMGSEQLLKRPITIPKKSKIRRNDPCPCGSGKKYKRCCGP